MTKTMSAAVVLLLVALASSARVPQSSSVVKDAAGVLHWQGRQPLTT
jgi:uncharacterized membrane protein YgcG